MGGSASAPLRRRRRPVPPAVLGRPCDAGVSTSASAGSSAVGRGPDSAGQIVMVVPRVPALQPAAAALAGTASRSVPPSHARTGR